MGIIAEKGWNGDVVKKDYKTSKHQSLCAIRGIRSGGASAAALAATFGQVQPDPCEEARSCHANFSEKVPRSGRLSCQKMWVFGNLLA